ncbi:hypothetical protein [Gordonia terrae]|uniref:hypothetical protein n=1 Tax=Gordonia terrae TaxID=2055 RepID=UPI003F6C4364
MPAPFAHQLPTDRYGLVRREATLRAGIGDDVVADAVRRGDLVRLAPGVWVEGRARFEGPEGADLLYRRRSVAVATSARDRGISTLSHESAAAMLGLDTLHPDRATVHLTKAARSSGGYVRGHRHVHNGPLGRDEMVTVDGLSVTSLERTAVDIAMAGDFAQGLVVFDRALAKDADRDTMTAMLDVRAGWKNVGTARRALSCSDRLSESVGESWSRAQMTVAGLPAPRLQSTFLTPDGEVRADFDWAGRVIGEFDGLQKYGRLLRPGEEPRDALIREKRREDALRARGIMVIRWTWSTLERRELVDLLRPWLATIGSPAA